MGCEINGTIMHRSWEACLRELPRVCGRGLQPRIWNVSLSSSGATYVQQLHCGILTIPLKGVSDGETKTKNLHPGV